MKTIDNPAPAGTDEVTNPTRPGRVVNRVGGGRARGYHQRRRALSFQYDSEQRAKPWRREV